LGCTIINFDEAGFRLVPYLRRIWAEIGTKPRGVYFSSNKKASVYGALIDGKELFHQWTDKLNSETFIEFVHGLVSYLPQDKKYVLILDNASYHKSKITMNFLQSLGENIFIEFLPPYSPQLNAIETCWKIVRHNVTNSNLFNSMEELILGIETFLKENIFMLNPANYLVR
jgi:transposase